MIRPHIQKERSVESLLKEHTGIILKVCAMYVPRGDGWREEVRDLFQEIALNLVERWPQFRGQCSEECILAEHTYEGVKEYKRRYFDSKHPRTEANIKETERILRQPHNKIPW